MTVTAQVYSSIDSVKKSLPGLLRVLPRDPSPVIEARDVYLAKSSNGEHNASLKPMDVCRLLGRCSRRDVTVFGITLRLLKHLGYLVEVRPRKYRPTKKFIEWAIMCRYPDCESESSVCGLVGVCPVHEYLREIKEKVKESVR